MRLLFDQNISFRITKKIQDSFPNCKHVSDCKLLNSEDLDIWKFAKENNYAIVTFDADYYDISIINGHPPKILWIRTGNLTTNEIVRLLSLNRAVIIDFLEKEEYKKNACLELEFK